MSRAHALLMRDAALRAADPEAAVASRTSRSGRALTIGGETFDLGGLRRVVVLGVGKACVAMARGLAPALLDTPTTGELTSTMPAPSPIPGVRVRVASHPLPDARSVAAAESALAIAHACDAQDLVIALISGGGSALWCAPTAGTPLRTLRAHHEALLAAGLDVAQMNAARARNSRVKAGRLALAAAPARMVTIVVSDVAGEPPSVVASGPTLPSAGSPALVASDGLVAASAAAAAARALGHDVDLVAAPTTAHWRDALARLSAPLPPGGARVMWGEVRVPLPSSPGEGGRCQHLALASLAALGPGESVACFSTDGVDAQGASGAIVTHDMRAGVAPTEIADALARADSHGLLARLGALVPAAPTGTNVNDLYLRLRSKQVGVHLLSPPSTDSLVT